MATVHLLHQFFAVAYSLYWNFHGKTINNKVFIKIPVIPYIGEPGGILGS